MAALDLFHPEIRRWFVATFRRPTDVQRRSWPRIAAGGHLLITAPTGSGKTLTAFLMAIDAFATGKWKPGATRVLYVSPLKALNNDIRANLTGPIAAIRARFAEAGAAFPEVRVRVRSGDTEPSERQRMLRRPPELLITTPESLGLLLTTVRGRQALSTVEAVILDEIHSLVENRRGAALMIGLERLVEVAGEFQRVALSATVRPLETVAGYVGGCAADGQRRPVEIVQSNSAKRIDFQVRFPEAARAAAENGEKIWQPLADSFRDRIAANRSTLFFANSRRMAEKIAARLNGDEAAPTAYAHHGSLAREIRTEVERRLKAGELKAIVATSSLEMGIDIGELDEVVLIQSPPSIAAALQRIGRAGHRVGETSRGTLFPTFAQDFLEAAVLAKAVRERDIEPLRPLGNALDVLAQTLVSCAGSEEWQTDDLFRMVRRAEPYRTLRREHFDLVVEMLAGRYAGTRVRDLRPRLAYDRVRQTVKARRGAVFALYTSGGTIPDRGYFALRHADSGAAIGELDEEFVWEASVGQTFSLGSQTWLIQRITHNDVLVRNAPPNATAPPFWRAENLNRSYHFSKRIGEFLENANDQLTRRDAASLHKQLGRLGFDDIAATELVDHLHRQRADTGCDLPHANHLLVEHVRSGPGGYQGADGEQQVVLHTLCGGRVNRPWALALEAAWRERFDSEPEVHADNNAIAVQVKEAIDPTLLLSLVTPANFERLLRSSLEGSGFFGARFRECAGRSLLLTKRSFKQRMPLWMTRLQAKKLLTATKSLGDFPVLLEAWRSCLQDEFDLPATYALLERLAAGELDWSLATLAVPSPFAAGIAFNQIGRYMYADDRPERGDRSALSDDLIRQAVYDRALRPAIEPQVVRDFEAKVQRTRPGYVPAGDDELREWVRERVAIPRREWFADVEVPDGLLRHRVGERVYLVHPQVPLGEEPARQAAEMLQFYGPRTALELEDILPFGDVAAILRELQDGETVVRGPLLAGSTAEHFCDAENLETLIRFQRAAARPTLEPRSAAELAPFLAHWQGLGTARSPSEALERLRGYSATVGFWLDEALAPRTGRAGVEGLENARASDGLAWRGTGKEAVAVGFEEDFQLVAATVGEDDKVVSLFKDPDARYTFNQLLDQSGTDAQTFNDALWQAVWAGSVAADGFQALAAGASRSYELGRNSSMGGRSLGRSSRARTRARARLAAAGWPGTWYRVAQAPSTTEPLERLEENKERSRTLLDRYGVLTPEHANREGGVFRWSALFPALRIMELSGEVVGGLFFLELRGPQFALPEAVRQLERSSGRQHSFWINALDPVSPCGLGLAMPNLPQRRLANHLGWFEGRLAVVSENFARRLTLLLDPDDPGLDALLPNLVALCRARKRLNTETINGEPARRSPYLPALGRHLKPVSDHKGVYFEAP